MKKSDDDGDYTVFPVKEEDLKIQAVGNVVYFLVKGEFLTGFCYNFKMRMTTLKDVVYTYDNHLFRGVVRLLLPFMFTSRTPK